MNNHMVVVPLTLQIWYIVTYPEVYAYPGVGTVVVWYHISSKNSAPLIFRYPFMPLHTWPGHL